MRFLVQHARLLATAWVVLLITLSFAADLINHATLTPFLHATRIAACALTALALAFLAGVYVGQGMATARREPD